jgi:hypothetical protein
VVVKDLVGGHALKMKAQRRCYGELELARRAQRQSRIVSKQVSTGITASDTIPLLGRFPQMEGGMRVLAL